MKYSPLFWPIQLKGSTIYILDETLLPDKIKYIKVKDYRQAARAIKEMKTRAVGQVILVFYIFLLVIRQNKGRKNLSSLLKKVANTINASRPTLPFKVITDMVLGWDKAQLPVEKCILGFLEKLKNFRIQQAKEASKLLKNKDVVLTHCNISGLMPLIAEFCLKKNKKISFYVTETRPYLQGARLTSWELNRAGFEVTIITDNMVAQVMHEGKIDRVIVGADNLAQSGDIANKIGTYQIAILARHFKIPFYVICPPKSSAASGKDIKIEIRPEKELLKFGGKSIAPKGVKGYYPAFDVTPKRLITKHIHLETKR
ncbi:MAG: S-methyl-5-thioribose-1-phosphate isomerase [Candidatus Omnitrophica bacterium]|nr:S-methyl-5-thioribose-1-phosphate isomerase [Candidatus Omnitrophota bacterium]